jgi:secreted Zn-dependent insulinase-like peptidase
LTSKSFDDASLPLKEKWYKIDYSMEKLSDEFLAKLKAPKIKENGKKLDLPPPNPLLPKKFDILSEDISLSAKT